MEEKVNFNCGIYLITNLINGKQYVGQSINLKTRWGQHKNTARKKDSNYPLYMEMNQYGIENFEFSILENCDYFSLNEKEKYYIKLYNTFIPNGYNQTLGGNSKLLYNYEEIVEKFKNGMNCKQLTEYYKCKSTVIHNALINNGISQQEIFKNSGYKRIGIIAFDINKNPLKYFTSIKEACLLLCNKKYLQSFSTSLKFPFRKGNYGYYWDKAENHLDIIKELIENPMSDEEFLSLQDLKNLPNSSKNMVN